MLIAWINIHAQLTPRDLPYSAGIWWLQDSEAFVAVLQCGPLAVHLTQFLLPSLFVTILLHFSDLNDMPMFLFTPGIQLNVIRVEEAANDWSIVVPFSLKFHCKYLKKKVYF